MNLADMVSMVSQLVGDTKEEKVFRPEIIQYINMGQAVLSSLLSNIELERNLVIDTTTINGSDADSEFALPSDLRRIVRITTTLVASTAAPQYECIRWPSDNVASLLKNTSLQPLRGARHYFVQMGGRSTNYTPGESRVRLYPAKQLVDVVTLTYVRLHSEFKDVDIWDGTLTASLGSTSAMADSSLPYAGGASKTGVDDAWVGAELFMRSGAAKGQRSRVSNFDEDLAGVYGNCDLSPALGAIPAAGDTYTLSMVPVIAPQHHHLIVYYAAALAANKVGLDGSGFMSYVDNEMDRMRKKWIDNVTANVTGQIQVDPRKNMVEG